MGSDTLSLCLGDVLSAQIDKAKLRERQVDVTLQIKCLTAAIKMLTNFGINGAALITVF